MVRVFFPPDALNERGGGRETMDALSVWVLPSWSLTVTETIKLPVFVGVPVMAPVVALILRPGGRPLAE